MKFKQLLSLLFLSFSLIQANNFHNQLIIPSVNIYNPSWEFAGQTISQKEDDSFEQLVSKWHDKLDIICRKLNSKIRNDIGASMNQLDYYMEQKIFVDIYTSYYQRVFGDMLEEDPEDDQNVLNFIQLKLHYLQCNKPINIRLKNNLTIPSFSFGSDKDEHYLFLNSNLYSPEHIVDVYELAAQKDYKFYRAAHLNHHESRVIEYCNLLHFGIAQALSGVLHQSDYFSKLLIYFVYGNKSNSKETYTYGSDYIQFRSFLEGCLQSKNPVEAAIFFEPQLDSLNQEFVLLWREFIEDIKNCYDQDNLQDYLALARYERQSHLYTFDDEDDNNEK